MVVETERGGGNRERRGTGCHRSVTEQAGTTIYPESGRQSGRRSAFDISHKRDFLLDPQHANSVRR